MEEKVLGNRIEMTYDGVSRVLFPVMKKGMPMLIWLWIKDWDGKLHDGIEVLNKFCLEWDEELGWWREQNPFDEYGVLKDVEYMLPDGMDATAYEYAHSEVNYLSHFNNFKLPLNSKNLNLSESDSCSTVTTKQARIPNSGVIEVAPKRSRFQKYLDIEIVRNEAALDYERELFVEQLEFGQEYDTEVGKRSGEMKEYIQALYSMDAELKEGNYHVEEIVQKHFSEKWDWILNWETQVGFENDEPIVIEEEIKF